MSKHNYMHVGPVNTPGNAAPVDQHVKDREAQQLRADIEAYQAAGGKIEVLGNTPRRDVHDYKKAEKGRKGGRKNKKDTIMTNTLVNEPRKFYADNSNAELVSLEELGDDEAIVEEVD